MSTMQSPDELYLLLARAGEARQIPDGAVIFERGERGASMYMSGPARSASSWAMRSSRASRRPSSSARWL